MEGYDTELVVFGGIASDDAALLSDDGARGPVQPPFAFGKPMWCMETTLTHGGRDPQRFSTGCVKKPLDSTSGFPGKQRDQSTPKELYNDHAFLFVASLSGGIRR
eukprot:symbB.v1.2.000099.t1/scaffold13.1/size649204/10